MGGDASIDDVRSDLDYERLLRKYMALVVDCEGYDYLQDIQRSHRTSVIFSDNEIGCLGRIAKETDGSLVDRR